MYSKKIYENVHFSVSYDFSKFDGSQKNQGLMFLVVPPKDKIALFNGLLKAFEICNHDTFMGIFLK